MYEALNDSAVKGMLILRSEMASKNVNFTACEHGANLVRINPQIRAELFSFSLIYANYDGNLA